MNQRETVAGSASLHHFSGSPCVFTRPCRDRINATKGNYRVLSFGRRTKFLDTLGGALMPGIDKTRNTFPPDNSDLCTF